MENDLRQRSVMGIVLDSYQKFCKGNLDLEGLQANVSAVMSAMEGDVPKSIRDAVFYLETQLDSIRFTVPMDGQRAYVDKAFRELEELLEEHT